MAHMSHTPSYSKLSVSRHFLFGILRAHDTSGVFTKNVLHLIYMENVMLEEVHFTRYYFWGKT